MVIAADQQLTYLNQWHRQEGMSKIVETLAKLGPPRSTSEVQSDLTAALQVIHLGHREFHNFSPYPLPV